MNEVVRQRIAQLFLERNISINNPGNISGTTVSTTNIIVIECNNNAINTFIKKLCVNLDITIEGFAGYAQEVKHNHTPQKNTFTLLLFIEVYPSDISETVSFMCHITCFLFFEMLQN